MAATRQPLSRSTQLTVESLEDRATPATAGTLDTAFGVNGLSLIGFNQTQVALQSPPRGNDITVQPDGKILVVGSAPSPTVGNGADMAIARLNPNGTLDTSFGIGGEVTIPFNLGGNNDDVANAVAIQPNGKIVIAGYATNAGFAVARLNTDGSLDNTFGSGTGKITYYPASFFSGSGIQGNAVALQSDGKIVVGGGGFFNPFVVARFNVDGTVDNTFGTSGYTNITVPGSFQKINAITIQSDGKIIEVGNTGLGTIEAIATRLNPNGTLDTSFATNGLFTAGFNTGAGTGGTATAVTVNSLGQIYIAGSKTAASNQDFALIRLNSFGLYDSTFGVNGGYVTVPINAGGNNNDEATSLALQSDGKILLGGNAAGPGGLNAPVTLFATARILANGQIDAAYGPGGKNSFNVGIPTPVAANGGAFASNGDFLIAGTSSSQMAVIAVNTVSTPAPPVPPSPPPPPPPGVGLAGSFLGVSTDGAQVLGYSFDTRTGLYDIQHTVNLSPILSGLFPGFNGVYRIAIGDVNGDTIPDFVVATGPGTPTQFAVISGDMKTIIVPPTYPFRGSPSFSGGAFVAVGDLNHDGRADIVITPDQGGGPRVVVYSFTATGGKFLADFLGINDPNFRGGARAAVGDVNQDGFADLVVAAGPGGGPRIAIYDGTTLFSGAPAKLVNDFFAFDTTLRNGAYVAVGDIDGDGQGDLVFGAGPGGAPRVLAISGKRLFANGAANALLNPIANFYVNGDTSSRGGVPITLKNLDNDNRADLVVGSGQNLPTQVRVYIGATITPRGGEPPLFQSFDPFNGMTPMDGIFVG